MPQEPSIGVSASTFPQFREWWLWIPRSSTDVHEGLTPTSESSQAAGMDDCVRRCDAHRLGIGPGELKGPGWIPVSHGLYSARGRERSLLEACRDITMVLPSGSAVSHFTAAQLHAIWLPSLPAWLPLTATLPPAMDRPERHGLYVARSRAGNPTADLLDGVPVLTPELTLGQLAEDLGLIDLVIAIDCALQLSMCDALDIVGGIRSRQRGLPMLRRALALCDGRSESPWETVLRLMHSTVGIPVSPQELIHDQAGRIVARADLRIVGTRRLPEYDGADHRDRSQHERDLRREKLLARLGLERYGYIAKELVGTPAQVIRDAEDALGWRHDPERLHSWLALANQSSLTARGRRRLLHRLHRFNRPLRGRLSRAA